MPEDTKINTNTSSSNNGSPKSTDGENTRAFYEWLAGLIYGVGCFQLSKKGYASLEIVMELRDKHCLSKIKKKNHWVVQ